MRCLGMVIACAAAAFALGACGGSPAVTTHTPAVPVASATSEPLAPPPSPPIDVSPVAAPRSLVLTAHFAHPGALLSVAGSWVQTPLPDAQFIAAYVTGHAVGDILDMDQPADVALGAQGKGMSTQKLMATSFAVKNGDQARAAFAGFRAAELGDGAVRLHPPGGKRDGDDETLDDHARVCELGPAFGAAPVRLVCASDDASLDALSAYLRRTVTRGASTSDVHVDMKMAAVREALFGQSKGDDLLRMLVGDPSTSPGPLLELARSGLDFLSDLDQVGVDLTLTPANADAQATLRFNGTKSVITRVATAHPERTDVPPETFWRLPGDAQAAFFHRGVDDGDFEPVRDVLLDGLSALLGDDGLGDSERAAIRSAMKELLSPEALAYASGHDVAAITTKLAAADSARPAGGARYADAARGAVEALFGWRVLEVDEPASKFSQAARDLVSAWSTPGVANLFKASFGTTPTMKLLTPPAGAPRGSTHLELDLPSSITSSVQGLYVTSARPSPSPTPAPAPVPARAVRLHVLFAADGPRTWIILACDPATLVAKMRTVLPGGAQADQLDARTDIDVLRNGRQGAGGFVTEMSMVTLGAQLGAMFGNLDGMSTMIQQLSPGTAPIAYTFTAQPDGTFVAGLHLGPTAVADLRRTFDVIFH